MSRAAPPPSGGSDTPSQAPHRVETEKRQRGRRGRGTATRIQRTARERQDAWAETGQPNRTYQLTRELDGLYGEHRDGQAGTLTDPYFGRTMKAGR